MNVTQDSIAPLVTVGVPTYNRPESLERCLSALLAQTFKNIEIVVSDNASTDPKVGEVLEEFKRRDHRVRVGYRHANEGPTANFSAVLGRASSRYFMWCADDDWLEPGAIERLLEAVGNPVVSLACPATITHLSNGQTVRDASINLDADPFARVLKYYRSVGNNNEFYGLGRTETFRAIGLKKRLADDWMFVAQLTYAGEVRAVRDAILHRSAGGTSRSVKNICAALQVPAYVAFIPNLSIAFAAARDIYAGRGVFQGARVIKRAFVSVVCFALLYSRLFVVREIATRIIWVLVTVFGEARYRRMRQSLWI